jgi:hypothetical protein
MHYKWPFSIAMLNYQRVSGNYDETLEFWSFSDSPSDSGRLFLFLVV